MRKPLSSISLILAVLMVLSIVPSYAFASENGSQTNSTNQTYDLKSGSTFGYFGNITEENFIDVKAFILESISKRIAELQNLYTDVGKASNVSDLKGILSNYRSANGCMRPGHIHKEPFGTNGFNLELVENVTDENFTAVQTEILSSLQNTTGMLKDQQSHMKVGKDNRTEELNQRITELQNLSTGVSKASTAAELKEVVFTFMQTQAVDVIEKKIEHLQAKMSESKNTSEEITSNEHLNSRITELTALKEKINGAKSLEDLKRIIFSSHRILGIREDRMHHGDHGRSRCHMDNPGRL